MVKSDPPAVSRAAPVRAPEWTSARSKGILAEAATLRWQVGAEFHHSLMETVYAEAARRWLDTGAGILGGCCGTTPEHIAALAALL